MRSKDTCKSWSKTGANDDVNVAFTRVLIKRQEGPNIGEVVGCAHDMNASPNKLFGNM
jgi:hypothetical protein